MYTTNSHFKLRRTYQSFSEVIKDIEICLTPRSLDLSNYGIGEDDMKKLAYALHKQKDKDLAILRLDLSENSIKDKGIEYLSKGLVGHKLWHLDLSSNFIKVIRPLCIVLNKTILNVLNLNSNLIDDQQVVVLARELKRNKYLFRLGLRSNKISDTGIRVLSKALEVNTHISTLDIAQNEFSENGAKMLLETLRLNRAITTLDIGNFLDKDLDYSLRNASVHSNPYGTTNDKINLLLRHNEQYRKEQLIKSMVSNQNIRMNRAKIMVLGGKGVGKSSFCTALFDKTYLGSLTFGLKEEYVTRLAARTGSHNAQGTPWTPVDLKEAYREECISSTLSYLHMKQIVEKHRRSIAKVNEEIVGKEKKGVADLQTREAAHLANEVKEIDFIDMNICIDAIKFCIYDFSCPEKMKVFENFRNIYLTQRGIFVVCFNMLDFIPTVSLKTIGRDRRRKYSSFKTFRSLGYTSSRSSESSITNTSSAMSFSSNISYDCSDSKNMNQFFSEDETDQDELCSQENLNLKKRRLRKLNRRDRRYFRSFLPKLGRNRKKLTPVEIDSTNGNDDTCEITMSPENDLNMNSSNLKRLNLNTDIEFKKNMKEKLSNFEHYLKLCSAHAPDSPIFIVGTHMEDALERSSDCIMEVNSILLETVKKYPKVTMNTFVYQGNDKQESVVKDISFFPVSSVTKLGFNIVRSKIESVARKTELFNQSISMRYLKVLDYILTCSGGSRSFSCRRIVKYAKSIGIVNMNEIRGFLKLFNELGMVFYYPFSNILSTHVLPMQFDLTALIKRLRIVGVETRSSNGTFWFRPSRSEFYRKYLSKREVKMRGLAPHLRILSNYSIISKTLLLVIYHNYKEWLDFFIELMESCFILVRWQASLFDIDDDIFLIPGFCEDKAYHVFSSKTQISLTDKPGTLYISRFNFKLSYLPSGVFHKVASILLSLLVNVVTQSEYVLFKKYIKLKVSLNKLGLVAEMKECNFDLILREDNGKIYAIITSQSFNQMPYNISESTRLIAKSVKKVHCLLESCVKQIQLQQAERIHISHTAEFCVSQWQSHNDESSFVFISEKEARRINLHPWFEFENRNSPVVNLEGFLDI